MTRNIGPERRALRAVSRTIEPQLPSRTKGVLLPCTEHRCIQLAIAYLDRLCSLDTRGRMSLAVSMRDARASHRGTVRAHSRVLGQSIMHSRSMDTFAIPLLLIIRRVFLYVYCSSCAVTFVFNETQSRSITIHYHAGILHEYTRRAGQLTSMTESSMFVSSGLYCLGVRQLLLTSRWRDLLHFFGLTLRTFGLARRALGVKCGFLRFFSFAFTNERDQFVVCHSFRVFVLLVWTCMASIPELYTYPFVWVAYLSYNPSDAACGHYSRRTRLCQSPHIVYRVARRRIPCPLYCNSNTEMT